MKCIPLFFVSLLALFTSVTYAGSSLPITLSAPTIPSSMNSGDTNSYTYTLTNHTPVDIGITSSSVTGNSSSVTLGSTCSVVRAHSNCSFTVNVNPVSGDITNGIHDTVNVISNSRSPTNQLTSAVDVSVSAGISATLSSPSPAITTTMVSGTSQTLTYTLTNTSSSTLSGITISGYSGNVTVPTSTNNCTGSVASLGSCTFAVTIAPEYGDIPTLAAQTISVNYGGASPLTTAVGPITVNNPALVAIAIGGLPPAAKTYASTDLGHTWSDITSNVGYTGFLTTATGVAGGATANGSSQLLNDTVLIGTGVSSGQAHYLTNASSNVATGSWSASDASGIGSGNAFASNALGYGNLNGSPYFFTGIVGTSTTSLFGYSLNGSSVSKTAQSALSSSTAKTVGFGGGYYLMGLSGSGSGTIYFTTDPTGTWTATIAPGGWTSSTNFKGIAYANVGGTTKTWVVGTGSAIYYTTSDLTSSSTWTAATGTFGSTIQGIVYNNLLSEFVAVDQSGNYYTSSDGQSWGSATSTGSSNVSGLTYSQSTGTMVIVGNPSLIYYSTGSSISWQAASGTGSSINFLGVASSTST